MTLELLKFWVINPTKTQDTNLCTNPSFESGTTGWTTGGTNTIATSAVQQRRGMYSCKCTYSNNDLLASYAITLTDTDHTASMDIYIPSTYEGTQLTLTWTGYTSGTVTAGLADMTIKDKWQRVHCHINPDSGDLAGTLTLSETGTNGDATEFIYIDGAQIEARATETTYFDGDTDEYCYWSGQQNASTSIRRADSRNGGTLVDLEDYMHISSFIGFGMNPIAIAKTETAGGRSLYQRTNKLDREMIIIGEIIGNSYDDLQTNRKALLDLFKPDLVNGEQEVTIRYMATTSAGLQASEVVDIRCRMKSDGLIGHWSKPTQEPITLMFEAYDDLTSDGNDAISLDYNDTLANANYIAKRDRDGVWSAMAGVTGTVYAIAQHPITKEIYIGGNFLNAGGDANADYLAKWNVATGAWVAVVAGINGAVYALAFDASGNLYIGGAFTNLGDANGDYIAKIDTAGNISSLGTGLNGNCLTIIIDNSYQVIVGGSFTSASGAANTNRLAGWNGTIWGSIGTGITSGQVNGLCLDKNNKLYIVGTFTNHVDANGDYVTVFDFDSSSYSSLSTGLNGAGYKVYVDKFNNAYITGDFTESGGVTANYITMWNQQKFISLGLGLDDTSRVITELNNLIIIAGEFTTAGDISLLDRIAVYLGNGIFQPLDINLAGTPIVHSLFVDNLDNLYVGFSTSGNAETAGDDTVTNAGTTTRPKFTITGPGLLRQIVNTTNNKGVYFNNFTLQSGEIVTLDFEAQEFTSNFRGNILSYVLEGISTLDFTLEPGDNRIATFIDGTTDSNTTATMQWKVKYWSLDEAKL
jgi:hypothetical protein